MRQAVAALMPCYWPGVVCSIFNFSDSLFSLKRRAHRFVFNILHLPKIFWEIPREARIQCGVDLLTDCGDCRSRGCLLQARPRKYRTGGHRGTGTLRCGARLGEGRAYAVVLVRPDGAGEAFR